MVQQKQPYSRLVDGVKQQVIFELHNVKGTLVGLRMPKYMQGVNVSCLNQDFQDLRI